MSTRWQHDAINLTAWRKQRKRILARDNYKCRIQMEGCTGKATQVDHLVPWVPGTIQHDTQLQAACENCNNKAGSPEKRNPAVPRPGWLNS